MQPLSKWPVGGARCETRKSATISFLRLGAIAAVAWLLTFPSLVAQVAPDLIAPSDVVYLGAFRIDTPPPATGYATWEYSNGPLAYYPAGNPGGPPDGYPGSLFMAGHVYESRVAEIEIPTPIASKTLASLKTARIIQPMTNVLQAVPNRSGFIMGMTWVASQGRVFFTHGQDYSDSDCDPAGSPPGLGSFAPKLSDPQTQGLWFLAKNGTTLHPFTSLRYIMEIPEPWRSQLNGAGIATGRHRGWCPEGTNLYASAPWARGSVAAGGPVAATTLMEFGSFTEPEKWSREHSSANAYQGAAWLTSGSKSAVIITGIIDFDPTRSYYGYDDRKLPPQCDPDPKAKGCTGDRGWRASDPRAAFLLYDPRDLADVAKGRKKAWQVSWYAKVDVSPYMLRRYNAGMLTTGADAEDILATYDRDRRLLYVSESFADGLKPIVHVFRIS
jgi:hypothetical protein